MKNTKLIDRIFSAVKNREEKILTMIFADLDTALANGSISTKQLDYKRQPDGTVDVTDKVNKEVTKFNQKGDQIIMTPGKGFNTPPTDDIVAELEGTPSIPDDVTPANKGVIDKEKAGLVGNDDTHYPSITFSQVHDTVSMSEVFECLTEMGISQRLFADNSAEAKKAKEEKVQEAKEKVQEEKEKLQDIKNDHDASKGEVMVQQGELMIAQGQEQLAQNAAAAVSTGASAALGLTTAKSAAAFAASRATGAAAAALGGPVGLALTAAPAVIGAINAARSGAQAIKGANMVKKGKKLKEKGKQLIEQEHRTEEIKDERKHRLKESTESKSKVGLNDTLQLIVGKMSAIKNAPSNQAKNKIVSELKDLSLNVKDSQCQRYLKPAIKELEKRSIKDEDFDTIVDDLITAFSQNPVTKVFTFSEIFK
jgi:hypothetical protein